MSCHLTIHIYSYFPKLLYCYYVFWNLLLLERKCFFVKQEKQVSETLGIAFILTFVGGFLDTYSYLLHNKVFANAQTGNIVLLAMNITERDFHTAFSYFLPIIAFVCGIFLAQWIRSLFQTSPNIHWRQITVFMEILALLGIAFIPANTYNHLANCMISCICAIQVESFRKVHGKPFTTTMCTGNLRSGTECLYHFLKDKKKEQLLHGIHYFSVILFFALGVAFGVFFIKWWENFSLFICCGLLSVCIVFMRERKEKGHSSLDNNFIK